MQRLNSDLANDLGNLLSRTVSMITKYNNGIIEKPKIEEEIDKDLENMAISVKAKVEEAMEHFKFNVALEEIWKLIRRSNKYVDETTPWILAKDEKNKDRLNTVLYNLAESLRIISVLINPFITNTSKEIIRQLGLEEKVDWESSQKWGLIPNATKVNKGQIIFPRLDIKEEIEKLDDENKKLMESRALGNSSANKDTDEKFKDEISLDDFAKLDIRLAYVESVEDHPNADKLYLLHLKIGNSRRVIVSNIKDKYTKEELTGKKILVLCNLKAKKFRGIESKGMLLAAEDENGKLSIASTLEDLVDGAKIS